MCHAVEQVAWAAGFFDGEGGTYFHQPNKNWRGNLIMRVGQTNPAVLRRFQETVGEGVIYGPMQKREGNKPVWVFSVNSTQKTFNVLQQIWPWISQEKRDQALAAIDRYHGQEAPKAGTGIFTTHCKRGHFWTPENTVIDGGKRRCRTCRNEGALQRYHKGKK